MSLFVNRSHRIASNAMLTCYRAFFKRLIAGNSEFACQRTPTCLGGQHANQVALALIIRSIFAFAGGSILRRCGTAVSQFVGPVNTAKHLLPHHRSYKK
jgi:hypothetical protein